MIRKKINNAIVPMDSRGVGQVAHLTQFQRGCLLALATAELMAGKPDIAVAPRFFDKTVAPASFGTHHYRALQQLVDAGWLSLHSVSGRKFYSFTAAGRLSVQASFDDSLSSIYTYLPQRERLL